MTTIVKPDGNSNAVYDRLEETVDGIDSIDVKTADEIVIYCNEGSKRGPKATKIFNDAGYPNAKILEGGIEGWEKADYDIVSK